MKAFLYFSVTKAFIYFFLKRHNAIMGPKIGLHQRSRSGPLIKQLVRARVYTIAAHEIFGAFLSISLLTFLAGIKPI